MAHKAGTRRRRFPLPEGEGKGEGKGTAGQPDTKPNHVGIVHLFPLLIAVILLLLAIPSQAIDSPDSSPSFYQRKTTWQETMLASRLALAEQLKADTAGKPFVGDLMRGGDPARQISVPVSGWRDLYLIVSDAGDYQHDVANWADARLALADNTEVFLDTLEPVSARQGWGNFKRDNKSTVGGPMKIGERTFQRGLGTHAASVIHYKLPGNAQRFEAWIGVDASRGKGEGCVRFIVARSAAVASGASPDDQLWSLLARDFSDADSRREMRWERADRIWQAEWSNAAELATRYAAAARAPLKAHVAETARGASDSRGLERVREAYYRSRAADEALAAFKQFNFQALRLAIDDLTQSFAAQYRDGRGYLTRLARLEQSLVKLSAELSPTAPGAEASISIEKVDRFIGEFAELQKLFEESLLANPLLDFDQLLLVRRRAGNLGLPQNWQGNSSLPRSGFDNEIAALSPVAPAGRIETVFKPEKSAFIGDIELHFDADRLLFSSIGTHDRWHVFELGLNGTLPAPGTDQHRTPARISNDKRKQAHGRKPAQSPIANGRSPISSTPPRQLTPADQADIDNYDACYLPDGAIIFCSTASFVGVPCVDGSDHVGTLFRLEADGRTIRQLGFDQDHNWSPALLHDGRVLYQRWEYADTPHSQSRMLFQMNPDGTSQTEYYGSGSYWPNAMFFARAVPGHATKVAAIVGGHHGVPRMGELVIFDPAKGRHEADGVVQRIPGYGRKVEPLIKDQLVDDSWPKFLHPFPLNEKYYLVSAKPSANSHWGIYLVDVFDNMLLLAEMPGHALLEPTPVRRTPRPPVIPSRVDPDRKDALVYLTDIYQGDGLKGVPRGTVKSLRVFTYHWAYRNMGGLLGTIGLDGPWDVRRILGTVPVEADGSAYFRVPANTPISVQPLDAEGKALQVMRSWFTAMPGENLSCVGCHEKQNNAPGTLRASAFVGRQPKEIQPWHGPARGFSYAREVQPAIDRHCIRCHDGTTTTADASAFDLRGTEKVKDFRLVTPGRGERLGGRFSVGYANVHRYVRRPGIESDFHLLTPLEFHADTTELVQLLRNGHYDVELDSESWDRLVTWIDLNAPYHGSWGEELHNPGEQRERRRELRRVYAGMSDEDAEEFAAVQPASLGTSSAAEIRNPKSEIRSRAAAPARVEGWPFDAAEAARRQAAAAVAVKRTLDLGDGITIELVLVPAGEFVMGNAGSTSGSSPESARIPRPFWMARTEINNAQFARFDPSHDSRVESKTAYQFGIHGYPMNQPQQPAVRVSWQQAMAFCDWLSSATGQRFSLPTEAQWEYACRAGSDQPFHFGGAGADFSKFANLADAKLSEFASDPYTVSRPLENPSPFEDYIPKETRFNDGGLVSMPVGRYAPNAWGLHDMHGNVAEWTRSDSADGKRVVRGGSWRDRPHRATAGFRLAYEPWQRVFNVGFRVIAELDDTAIAHASEASAQKRNP